MAATISTPEGVHNAFTPAENSLFRLQMKDAGHLASPSASNFF
jgi:hypothetical protein